MPSLMNQFVASCYSQIGAWCEAGRLMPTDQERALKFYFQALHLGDIAAGYKAIALLTEKQEMVEVIKCYQEMIFLGHHESYFALAEIYYQQKNNVEVLHCYLKAIEAGEEKTYGHLKSLFTAAADLEKVVQAQISSYKKAIQAGDKSAYLKLGKFFEDSGDNEKALHYYFKEAMEPSSKGNALMDFKEKLPPASFLALKAYYYMGLYYEKKENWQEAFAYYQQVEEKYRANFGVVTKEGSLAEIFSSTAYRMGILHQEDRYFSDNLIVRKNSLKAIQYYQEAATHNAHAFNALEVLSATSAKAALSFAELFEKHSHNSERTFQLYLHADKFEEGDGSAQYWLGNTYRIGMGERSKDLRIAMSYYFKAALRGHKQATIALKEAAYQAADNELMYKAAVFLYDTIRDEDSGLWLLKKLVQNDFGLAKSYVDEKITLMPYKAFILGTWFEAEKNYDAAYHYYAQVRSLIPNATTSMKRVVPHLTQPKYIIHYADILYDENQSSEKAEAFVYYFAALKKKDISALKKLLAIVKNQPIHAEAVGELLAKAHVVHSVQCYKIGALAQSASCLAKLTHLALTEANARYALYEYYFQNNQLAVSMQYLAQAVQGNHPQANLDLKNYSTHLTYAFLLAEIYFKGEQNIPANYPLAQRLLINASDAGSLDASLKLGGIFEQGLYGQAVDATQAARYYLRAAKGNDDVFFAAKRVITHVHQPSLWYEMGQVYHARKEIKSALAWYLKAAYADEASAKKQLLKMAHADGEQAFEIAKCYAQGEWHAEKWHYYAIALQKNHGQALQEVKHFAAEGDAEAQYCLGQHYVLKKDTTQAIIWHLRAAEQNHVPSVTYVTQTSFSSREYLEIAHYYANGEVGIVKNPTRAMLFYQKAYVKREPKDLFALGQLYLVDDPVGTKDVVQAWSHFMAAYEQGYFPALASLMMLIKEAPTQEKYIKLAQACAQNAQSGHALYDDENVIKEDGALEQQLKCHLEQQTLPQKPSPLKRYILSLASPISKKEETPRGRRFYPFSRS